MNDRFKFKAVLHQNKYEEYQLEKFLHQRVFDVMSINLGIEYSTIEIIAEYPNGDWAVREIDDEDIDLIQCTGLKDKNGKLIFEGDIVKFKDVYRTHRQGTIKYTNEDALFCLSYIDKSNRKDWDYVSRYNLEIIGNIYENKELLEDTECQK